MLAPLQMTRGTRDMLEQALKQRGLRVGRGCLHAVHGAQCWALLTAAATTLELISQHLSKPPPTSRMGTHRP